MNSTLEKDATSLEDRIPCPLWRRLGAMVYDTLLLICIVFIAWQPIPLLGETHPPVIGEILRRVYLLTICFVFLGWFWCHGGQTLGMKAWKIKLVREHEEKIRWQDALGRFAASILSWLPFGLGFIWSVFPPQKLAWHDRLSKTRLVVLTR